MLPTPKKDDYLSSILFADGGRGASLVDNLALTFGCGTLINDGLNDVVSPKQRAQRCA